MRNACKTGGSVKKKYQAGGSTGYMKPTKKIMTKTGPDSYDKAIAKNKAAMDAIIKKEGVRKAVEKAKAPMPKKQMGGPMKPPTGMPFKTKGQKAAQQAQTIPMLSSKVKTKAEPYMDRATKAKMNSPKTKALEAEMAKKIKATPKKQMGGVIVASPIDGPRRKVAGSNMAKGGQSFPDLNRDGKVTKADVLKGRGVYKKGGTKKYQGGGPKTAGQAYMKYVPNAAASDTLASQGDARFQQPYYEDDNFTAKKKMLQMTYGDETPDPQFGTERRNQTPQEVSSYSDYLKKLYNKKTGGGIMKKGGQAHPGFKAVQAKIAAKSGVSKKAAGAILAASTRKASAKAKAANPRLKRVKG